MGGTGYNTNLPDQRQLDREGAALELHRRLRGVARDRQRLNTYAAPSAGLTHRISPARGTVASLRTRHCTLSCVHMWDRT
jgi:hypothetical protein